MFHWLKTWWMAWLNTWWRVCVTKLFWTYGGDDRILAAAKVLAVAILYIKAVCLARWPRHPLQ
jgi:hypothetical protein